MKINSLIETGYIHSLEGYFSRRLILLWLLAAVAMLTTILPFTATALSPITQGFSTDENLPLGSIVSLENNTSDRVVATTVKNVDSTLGVVVNDGSSPITLSNGKGDQVLVATSGLTSVLVSDINGKIFQGDQITASPIKGVGMKATGNVKVVGIAQGEPTNSHDKQQTYKDAQGNEKPIVLGEVPVLVNVSYFFKQPERTVVPVALQNVANAFAGKSVETLPILISAAVFIITLIVVVSIIYSMIRSSIISVGRNPMSQSAIYRDVIQLSALVLAILTVSLIAIYLILTRL